MVAVKYQSGSKREGKCKISFLQIMYRDFICNTDKSVYYERKQGSFNFMLMFEVLLCLLSNHDNSTYGNANDDRNVCFEI